jgi:hypothetical protein
MCNTLAFPLETLQAGSRQRTSYPSTTATARTAYADTRVRRHFRPRWRWLQVLNRRPDLGADVARDISRTIPTRSTSVWRCRCAGLLQPPQWTVSSMNDQDRGSCRQGRTRFSLGSRRRNCWQKPSSRSGRGRHSRLTEHGEGERCCDQHEPAADKQRYVQAVDERAVHQGFSRRTELLRHDAALTATHVLDDVRGICLG